MKTVLSFFNFNSIIQRLIKPIILIVLLIILLVMLFISSIGTSINAARIKDIATIAIPGEGEIVNQVIGYGLVAGLNNSGDNMQTSMTAQSVVSMLKRFGITPPATNPRIRNVAAVMVTATIPNYLKRGAKVDVVVSTIGDAKSLQGGVLLMSPIADQSGNIVGMAQGPLTVGGYDYENYGARIRKNETTTGRVQNGLILERDINANSVIGNQIQINLHEPDYSTANNIATVIGNGAQILDAGTVMVDVPNGTTPQQFIAQIEGRQVVVDIPVARVVINERTGAIVVGGNVEILPSVVVHGNLEIVIDKYYFNNRPYYHNYNYYLGGAYNYASRPAAYPFGGGLRMPKPVWNHMDTTIKYDIKALENYEQPHALTYSGANVQDLVNGLRELFVKPRDLVSIFQALKESGALKAELIIQ